MAEQVNPTSVKFPIKPELVGGIIVPWEELSVAVDGPTEVQNLALDEEGGQVFISFETDITGQYTVYVKHNEVDLSRTPVTINVHKKGENAPPPAAAPPSKVSQAPASANSNSNPNALKPRTIRFKVPSSNIDPSGVTVYLKEGPDQPASTSVEKDGDSFSVCITIAKPGKYQIGLRKANGDIPNSPFTINVPEDAFKY